MGPPPWSFAIIGFRKNRQQKLAAENRRWQDHDLKELSFLLSVRFSVPLSGLEMTCVLVEGGDRRCHTVGLWKALKELKGAYLGEAAKRRLCDCPRCEFATASKALSGIYCESLL